jgi:hypothetical protein
MCDTSVPALITKMLDIKRQIEAEKGVAYKPNCFMTLFFNKLSGYNNNMFCYELIAACSTNNKGKIKMVYKTEQAASTWTNLMPSSRRSP